MYFFVVDRLGAFFSDMLLSVKFAKDEGLVFSFSLFSVKNAKIVQL